MGGSETMLRCGPGCEDDAGIEMGKPPVEEYETVAMLIAESELIVTGPLCGRALAENDRSCALRRRHEGPCLPASAAEGAMRR